MKAVYLLGQINFFLVYKFLSLLLNEFLQSEIMQKSRSVIYKRRGKKLISKIIKHKLNNSSKIQFAFFYPKDIQFFWKTIDFVENLEMTQIAGDGVGGGIGEGVMFFASL